MKNFLLATMVLMTMCAFAQSPAHEALRKEIAELQKKPTVFKLPPYLDAEKDFGDVCRAAAAKNKKVIVSIGREACGRCQRFYELVQRGVVKIDTKAYEFVRLDIDEHTQREYFMGTFDPPNGNLPFVGVTNGELAEVKPCLTGSAKPAEYQALMEAPKPAAKPEPPKQTK